MADQMVHIRATEVRMYDVIYCEIDTPEQNCFLPNPSWIVVSKVRYSRSAIGTRRISFTGLLGSTYSVPEDCTIKVKRC